MLSSVLRSSTRSGAIRSTSSSKVLASLVRNDITRKTAVNGSSSVLLRRTMVQQQQQQLRAITLAIARETYDKWERRAPLCPSHIETLKKHDSSLEVLVQPSPRRIFTDEEYENAGAIIENNLQNADVILGVKQVAIENLIPNKTYMFFAHVIKGQAENMELLNEVLKKNIRLVDYECITAKADPNDHKSRPKRLVTFGRYAGIAGMLDMFQGLGQQLLAQGYSTPFLNSPLSYMHRDLSEAKLAVQNMGNEIISKGLPKQLNGPFVFAFTGNGNVTQGAREIFDLLPMEMITKEELIQMRNGRKSYDRHKLYGIQVLPEDTVEHIDTTSNKVFDKFHYRTHPDEYVGIFHREIAPHINVLVNGIYWDERFPRLLTKEQIRELRESGNKNLVAVADISCDVNGSIEFLTKSTVIEQPFFQYNPISGKTNDKIDGEGICMMGVDILPTELAKESTKHFGDALLPLLTEMKHKEGLDNNKPTLPEELNLATVADDGKILARFNYIDALLRKAMEERAATGTTTKKDTPNRMPSILISLEGHLFDSGLINKVLDIVEHYDDCYYTLEQCVIGRKQQSKEGGGKSTLLMRVESNNSNTLQNIPHKVQQLIELIHASDATFSCYDGKDIHHVVARTDQSDEEGTTSITGTSSGGQGNETQTLIAAAPAISSSTIGNSSTVTVKSHGAKFPKENNEEERVLVLGAGRVAASLCEYLGRNEHRKVVVASNIEQEVTSVVQHAKKGQGVIMDVGNNREGLSRLIKESDVVVSLLPAPMHPTIAEECIRARTDLVTASYLSDEIKAMESDCRNAGIYILKEMGLDPGMDHMSAMKIMNDIKRKGGRITKFQSVCGGLPNPKAAATNDLQYKFSWSPMGVLTASSNSATFKKDDIVVDVPGDELLTSVEPMLYNLWPDLPLECLPNRNSLKYGDLYGISNTADTIFRGTLRYSGFSHLMYQLRQLGLFSSSVPPDGVTTWKDLLKYQMEQHGQNSIAQYLEHASGMGATKHEAERAEHFIRWLGLMDDNVAMSNQNSIVESFCNVLQHKLAFEPNERDMVVMHHTIEASFDDKECNVTSHELIHSKLRLEGDDNMSAMCKTVGYTAAAGAELLLSGGLEPQDTSNNRGGILLPIQPQIYNPVLRMLEAEGLKFDETVFLDHEVHSQHIHPHIDEEKSA